MVGSMPPFSFESLRSQCLSEAAPFRWLEAQKTRTFFSKFFSDISERNNDYSNTLYFRRGLVGEVGVVMFFVLEVLDYEIRNVNIHIYKKLLYRSQF